MANLIKSYLAFVHGADGFLCDVFAANNMITLTRMVRDGGVPQGGFVRYNREFT